VPKIRRPLLVRAKHNSYHIAPPPAEKSAGYCQAIAPDCQGFLAGVAKSQKEAQKPAKTQKNPSKPAKNHAKPAKMRQIRG